MFTGNLIAFAALSIALTILTFVSLILASRHDKVVSLAGPLEEEKAVLSRIAEKRATLDDIEEDLRRRREALANLADLGAEADALERKLGELQSAWNNRAPQRDEIEALRRETEEALTAKLTADADLAAQRADLAEVSERLLKAESLVHRIDALATERQELETRVEELRENARDLEEAASRFAAFEQQLQHLNSQKTQIEGQLAAKTAELRETDERLSASRAAQIEVRKDLDQVSAELAVGRQRIADCEIEQAKAQERVVMLEARKAALEREIEKSKGITSGGTGLPAEDPLLELRQRPQVVERLKSWSTIEGMTEADAIHRVKKRFEAFGLNYPERTLLAFHTAMKVNDTTQMAVLSGISGTGKSQLPRQYAAGMGIGFLQVPVQPRWDSPQDLLGFYNYIEGRFRPTDMARAMFALDEQNNPDALPDRLLMVLLDEMNLARVEYYFSDFLSRLESRPARGQEGNQNLRKDAEIELEIPKAQQRLFPGYNLLFAGTMNEDESTQSLSDKVVDRANVMRFGAPKQITHAQAVVVPKDLREAALSRKVWEKWCDRKLQPSDRARADQQVNEMLRLMQDFGKPFGHRLGRAILAYASVYPDQPGVGDRVAIALADQIEMRLLPKLRSVDVEEKSQQFDELQRMAVQLGDDALAEAIRQSVDAAEASTGQFVWKGVVR